MSRRPDLTRRQSLSLLLATAAATMPSKTRALPVRRLAFPRDHGAHPEFQTEWWYITGDVRAERGGERFGFQITFFRSRVPSAESIRSAFAAKQLVSAHAAVTDIAGRKLHHDQRVARAGFGIAEASDTDTAVSLRDWSLRRESGSGSYRAIATSDALSMTLVIAPTQPPVLQGDAGLSRKGPDDAQASYYYSLPHLTVSGRLGVAGRTPIEVRGRAWLDHEWSQAFLHPEAVGWDWIGMNLEGGGALTAFRLRRANGGALWAGGSWRPNGGAVRSFAPQEVVFTERRRWTSPASNASYPVEWQVATPVGTYIVRSLVDDQELDSRQSTGAIYWEGLSDLLDPGGSRVGSGYLEMTGYADRLRI